MKEKLFNLSSHSFIPHPSCFILAFHRPARVVKAVGHTRDSNPQPYVW